VAFRRDSRVGKFRPGQRVLLRPAGGAAYHMKDINSTAVGRAPEPAEGFANRKLIRPTLNRSETRSETRADGERRERPERISSAKKIPPAEQTHAENFYYQKQMQAKTPMVIVLQDGDSMEGVIEWYDKSCIKINRTGQPNVLIYKAAIKYMFKASEERR
jgi:host factor-I protein